MKNKKLFLIPTVAFPYIGMIVVRATNWPSANTMPSVCGMAFLAATALTCNIVYIIKAAEQNPIDALKTAFAVKVLSAPGYVLCVSVLTRPLTWLLNAATAPQIYDARFEKLVIIVVASFVLSGMISIGAVAKHSRINKKASIAAMLCQIIPCADIISLFCICLKCRNK